MARREGQHILLLDAVQLLCSDGLRDEVKFFAQCLVSVRHTDVGDVCAADVVTDRTLFIVVGAQPITLSLRHTDIIDEDKR